MPVNERPDLVLAELAARQDGVFTRRQAKQVHLSAKQIRHRLDAGLWIEVFPRVFRLPATPATKRLLQRGALAFAGTEAVLATRSAGELWGLDRMSPAKPELLVPSKTHPSHPDLRVIRTAVLEAKDRAWRDGLPVTSADRTLIDLSRVLEAETLECAIESARRLGLTTLERLSARADELCGTGRPGSRRLRELIEQLGVGAPSEFPLEVKVARLLRGSSLPRPVQQFRVGPFRLDFAWPALLVALECDGRAYHGDFSADRARWSYFAERGWRILFVTWNDVTRDPHGVLDRVAAALAVQ